MAEVITKKPRIAGLDGIRALAVAAVLLYHLAPTIIPGGYIGVDIFFVISGFLITTLLLREYEKTGRVNFTAFWQRRARRLLPALVLTIGIVSSVALFVRGDILVGLGRQILGALTFSGNWVEVASGANYFDATNPHLFTNFWSLAVEEQFYLVWPFIVIGLLTLPFVRRHKYTGVWFGAAFAIGSAVLMMVLFDGQNATRVYYGSDTHLFGLMIGAMLAFWEYARTAGKPIRRQVSVPFQLSIFGKALPLQLIGWAALAGIIACMAFLKQHELFGYRGGLLLACLLTGLILMATMSRRGILQKVFTFPLLVWIGVRSYGMYLWHYPIFVLIAAYRPQLAPWLIALLAGSLTIIIAALSYHYIEMPVRQRGLRATLRCAIKRQPIIISNAQTRWRVRPHPMLFGSLLVVTLTIAAVITAPHQTQAETQIKAGEVAAWQSQERPVTTHAVAPPPPVDMPKQPQPIPITGSDITLIGDSVALASAPALVERFPGIIVDAKVSRSLRSGGFDDIAALQAAGNLRRVVIIALGTNGYYGTGNLDTLMTTLAERQVIFVTAHGPDEWDAGNNQAVRAAEATYHNVFIAEWDQAIAAHPEGLGPDGIHPNTVGGQVYADCIAAVITKLQ